MRLNILCLCKTKSKLCIPFAGTNQIRFPGYNLSRYAQHPDALMRTKERDKP